MKTVSKILKNLKNRKAAGLDRIRTEDWNIGIMHLIYRGKGDINELTNYRGITVNNAISKNFTTLLNSRHNSLVEESGILGNILQGGRYGKRATALKSGKIVDRDVSLIFIDLSAYECVYTTSKNVRQTFVNMHAH